jgi:hypothetical protein
MYLKIYNLRLKCQLLSLHHGRMMNYIVTVYKEVDR